MMHNNRRYWGKLGKVRKQELEELLEFEFSIYTPFGSIPQPGPDNDAAVRASLLPAVIGTLKVDNRNGTEPKTAIFAIDFQEAGTRVLRDGADNAATARLGFAWRRRMGVMGMLDERTASAGDGLYAFQRWSAAEGVSDINPVHELGSCGGLAFEVPPGAVRTLVVAIGVYLDGVVTTGLEGHYYYTRFYSSLDQVLTTALDCSAELRQRANQLDQKLLASNLSAAQQFMIAHGTRGYYGSTQLLDVAGEPFWVVNEGEYCMMNTLDLSIDHAFWELEHNPWLVRNLLTNFARHYSYRDQVKSRGGELLPGGLSFCHDMGANNNFSRTGHSGYELSHLNGCFSYMTQEQLCNWVLLAVCYVLKTNDTEWLLENAHLISACADSMRNRANPRTGVMIYDSARCAEGQEITTYDSLDESLGQARANTYLAAKCWATWIGLDVLSRLAAASGGEDIVPSHLNLAEPLAKFLIACAGSDGTLPAVIEKGNRGYQSRILPVIESLVYPAYWLDCVREFADTEGAMEVRDVLIASLHNPLLDVLKRHTIRLLLDPQRTNLFADGGIKLSSTANNSWMSKIALFEHVARRVLQLDREDPRIAQIFNTADAAHVKWQTDGSGYWACCDQFVLGQAKGSRYYPRIITAALWMREAQALLSDEDKSRYARTRPAPAVEVTVRSERSRKVPSERS